MTAEIFARLPQSVGNVAFTPDNQVIFSHHPFYSPDVRVAKLTSATTFEPFPNAEWNTPLKGSDQYLDNVLGLRSDENGVVWMIDMGFRTHITPKLVGWNTHTNRLERIYYMPEPVTRSGSQPQDIVIDHKNRKFYIADEDIGPGDDGSKAAIIVIDMNTGRARRVLEGDRSTVPENMPITVDGNDLTVPGKDGKPTIIKVGCDGITMDAKAEWLYYAPLSGRSLYRIRVADLNDENLSNAQLSAKVERYSDKPNNGGCRSTSREHLSDGGRDQIDRRNHAGSQISYAYQRRRDGLARRYFIFARRLYVRIGIAGFRRRNVPRRQGRRTERRT